MRLWFERFSVEKMGFCCFQLCKKWFSSPKRISGYFWRCKTDEILTITSFYPWFSVRYCLFGFLFKVRNFLRKCLRTLLRLCVQNLPTPVKLEVFGLPSIAVVSIILNVRSKDSEKNVYRSNGLRIFFITKILKMFVFSAWV